MRPFFRPGIHDREQPKGIFYVLMRIFTRWKKNTSEVALARKLIWVDSKRDF